VLREESAADRAGVRAVHLAAFPGEDEANLVERLQTDGDALVGLAAEVKARIVGHILFSWLPIETRAGVIPAAALAPLGVVPEWQGRGIGAALVERGLALCRERGIAVVVVLGDPGYYSRFGFRAEKAAHLQTAWSGPHLMAIELAPGALGDGRGIAHYPAAFTTLLP
jgi:putative acetyltransferase